MVQDYRYLNEQTVKKYCPLPLILNIIESMGMKKVFITLEGLFELIVMFFRLINFPTTFQMMINKILWNLINTEVVRSFIDNIIVEIEEEERYNKIMEEVVKRLTKNNLYVKWKKRR